MKQKLFKTMLLLCALIVGSGTAWAGEAVYKTALFGSSYNSQTISSYTAEWSATNDGFTVNLANFNNNNNGWAYVKCGRKNYESVATITTSAAIDKAITKVVLTIDAITASNVNSIKLFTSSNGSTWTEAGVYSKATGAQSVEISSPEANLYYKAEFDCASGSSNGLVTISKVEYYYDPDAGGSSSPEKQVTFSYEDYRGEGTLNYGSEYTMIETDVRITHNMFYCSDTYPQAFFYGYGDVTDGLITITPSNGATITKIEFITPQTDYNGYQDGGEITTLTGTVSANNEDKTKATKTTWTGSANTQFTITNTKTILWSSIVVTYTGGLPQCATPVISGETPFVTYSTVTITCATEGASIQYCTSTDGVTYTDYQFYTAPFQISESKTVKAKATKEGMVPSVAYKGFTQQGSAPNIRYFISDRAMSGTLEFIRLEDALVTYKNGKYAYLEDAYGAIMLYNCASDLAAGDKINGYMHVTGYTVYNNLPEITGYELVEGYVKSAEPEVKPTVMTLEQLLGDPAASPYEMYLSKYIKIENATVTSAFSGKECTIEQGGYSIVLRDQNSSATLTSTAGDNVTVTGHVAIFGTTNQIAVYVQDQIVVSAAPAVPTITVSPSSLTGFTYVVDNGPSAVQNFTVSGTNLTADLTLTLNNSDYEMSLIETDGYASSLTLPQSAGSVFETTIYVRLKEGLAVNASYNGSIAITSTGAAEQSVTLSGSVKAPEALNVTWDLSKASYDEITDADIVTWSSPIATVMNSSKNGGTSASNYLGGDSNKRTSSRFYSGNTLTITPESGYSITSVEFTATSEGYATTLANSTWTNATASASGTLATVTPTNGTTVISAVIGGTCGFTSVKVYYEAVVPVPYITVDPAAVNATATETEGTLDITYANLTISDMTDFAIQYYDAEGKETTEPAWIEVLVAEQDPQVGEGYVVSYYMIENDGAARTAYFKVYAMVAETNLVYSNLVTVNQAAPVSGDQFALFTGDLVEGDYIIYYNGKAMNTTVTNNRLQYEEVTPEGNTITTDDSAIVWHIAKSGDYWTIYNAEANAYAAANGTKNQAQMLANGTDDKALWTITGTETYEFVNKSNAANSINANLRNNGTYGFACYAVSTGGELSLYKKVTESVTLNAYGYATFCSTNALDFSDDSKFSAWQITGTSGSTITFEQITGTVAAETGVLLKGSASGIITIPVAASGSTLSSNLLVGITTPTDISAGQYYGLSGDKFVKVGAGTVPAGKALLPASVVGSSIKAFNFVFEDDPDGIEKTLSDSPLKGENIYNLAGQRLSKMQKGINIVNGKKILK
ncbi:MAG: chitobiase/beta-hexosaminidase C-terminal domain-containing protein [Bacteroidaceae bacterium]|nr:chitobiase/beta-hexosaminidase C-terminal domain-containing protein [Bacteroidaceae bacterium]